MAIYKRGEVWWINISVRGRPRIRETTGLTDKKHAQEYHDKYKAKLYDSIQSGKTLGDAIKLWLRLKPRNKRETSAIKTVLKIYPSRPLSEITGIDIHDALMDKSASNANRLANNIRAAINLAVERKWCDEIVIPKRETVAPPFRFLTKADWEKLKGELAPHVLSMAIFALATGLRLSNVTGLQWANVNLEKELMWVEAASAKGKKLISVPLSNQAIDILKLQIGKHGSHVFVYRGKTIISIKTSWKKALVRAGLFLAPTGKLDKNGDDIMKSEFRWHDLRHTWASWHALKGTPLGAIQELGAWSSLELVNRYAHLTPSQLKGFVDNS